MSRKHHTHADRGADSVQAGEAPHLDALVEGQAQPAALAATASSAAGAGSGTGGMPDFDLDVLGQLPVFLPDPILIDPALPANPHIPPVDVEIGTGRYNEQWYLTNDHKDGATYGLNVEPVWQDYTGRGVHVGVFDSGVQATHYDLDGNYDASREIVVGGTVRDETPTASGSAHGTAVAGIIAAENNEYGSRGVAYDASITGVHVFGGMTEAQKVDVLTHMNEFDVVNNSWGWWGSAFLINSNTTSGLYQSIDESLANAADRGRGGLGTVVVTAAGNDREDGPGWVSHRVTDGTDLVTDANADNFVSDRHVVTVGAVDQFGNVLDYSTPGASLLVSAFSGAWAQKADGSGAVDGILTTDITGTAGFNTNPTSVGGKDGDYTLFNGTSAATPEVSGVVALMLEANPDLGWRDVRAILGMSARQTGAIAPSGWEVNGADNWNGGGMHFSNDYGFGTVDAKAAVRLAETWTSQSTSANEAHAHAEMHNTVNINDASGGFIQLFSPTSFKLNITDDIRMEDVTLRLTGSHPNVNDLRVELVSPDGTNSVVLNHVGSHDGEAISMTNPAVALPTDGWTMSSNEFMGEMSKGEWTVVITDTKNGDVGSITSAALDVYGDGNTADDTYVYTDEFGSQLYGNLTNNNEHDLVISDNDGGIDTINAAAVSTDSVIDLEGGHYRIAGREGFFGWGSSDPQFNVIENIVGGDGSDQLGGNFADNVIKGMRGNDEIHGYDGKDTLDGGAGSDTLEGGVGDDTLSGGADADTLVFKSGWGHDTVTDFEHGSDKLDMTGVSGLYDIGALTVTAEADGARVTFGDDSILLKGVDAASITSADFVFTRQNATLPGMWEEANTDGTQFVYLPQLDASQGLVAADRSQSGGEPASGVSDASVQDTHEVATVASLPVHPSQIPDLLTQDGQDKGDTLGTLPVEPAQLQGLSIQDDKVSPSGSLSLETPASSDKDSLGGALQHGADDILQLLSHAAPQAIIEAGDAAQGLFDSLTKLEVPFEDQLASSAQPIADGIEHAVSSFLEHMPATLPSFVEHLLQDNYIFSHA